MKILSNIFWSAGAWCIKWSVRLAKGMPDAAVVPQGTYRYQVTAEYPEVRK